jgi:hypothetical protein
VNCVQRQIVDSLFEKLVNDLPLVVAPRFRAQDKVAELRVAVQQSHERFQVFLNGSNRIGLYGGSENRCGIPLGNASIHR